MESVEKKIVETGRGRVAVYTIRNSSGASVTVSSLGATIVSVEVPDADGKLANVVILSNIGFQGDSIWESRTEGDNSVVFICEGRSVEYVWTSDNVLEMYLSGEGSVDFGVRLLVNLDGADADTVRDQTVWANTVEYAECNDSMIKEWEDGVMQEAAVIASHASGRQLSVFTTLPLVGIRRPEPSAPLAETSASPLPDTSSAAIEIACLPLPEILPRQLLFLEFKTMS